MQQVVERAKKALSENTKVLYGIFGIVETTGYFPPRVFLNEFLLGGSEPCDQDGRMEKWLPFELSEEEYEAVLSWWQSINPGVIVNSLGSNDWDEWVQEILENT